jgi:SAM-dependent methyltransferase
MDQDQDRARSFGQVAAAYQAFRPGPPAEAVDWVLDGPARTVVDLGAGTGALSRLLVDRAPHVIAVEPDPAMRRELEASVDGLDVREGTGEHLPVDDASVDAIVASSSWHWIDPAAGCTEAARVLRPGGTLAALWTGPDLEGTFMRQAQAALAGSKGTDTELLATVAGQRNPGGTALVIPQGQPLARPDNEKFRFVLDLDADQLIGLLSTLSWVILLDEARRNELFESARRLLREFLGVEGDVTVAVEFLCDAYRTHLTAAPASALSRP